MSLFILLLTLIFIAVFYISYSCNAYISLLNNWKNLVGKEDRYAIKYIVNELEINPTVYLIIRLDRIFKFSRLEPHDVGSILKKLKNLVLDLELQK